jgi:folate-dependent phosphoribosylglycinamide formyltransferase PurN
MKKIGILISGRGANMLELILTRQKMFEVDVGMALLQAALFSDCGHSSLQRSSAADLRAGRRSHQVCRREAPASVAFAGGVFEPSSAV